MSPSILVVVAVPVLEGTVHVRLNRAKAAVFAAAQQGTQCETTFGTLAAINAAFLSRGIDTRILIMGADAKTEAPSKSYKHLELRRRDKPDMMRLRIKPGMFRLAPGNVDAHNALIGESKRGQRRPATAGKSRSGKTVFEPA